MTTTRLSALTALTALLTACAGSASPPSDVSRLDRPESFSAFFRADVTPYRTEIGAPVERVAVLVPGVYEHWGLPVQRPSGTRDPVFLTPTLRIKGQLYEGERNSDYLDCGESGPGGERADLYEVEFAVYTRLLDDGAGGTIVETMINGRARRQAVTDDSAVRCVGTGKLERMIGAVLRGRAGGTAASEEDGR